MVMAGSLAHGFVGVIRKEIMKGWPVLLFFVIGMLVLLTIIKLVLAEFAIAYTELSMVLVSSLIAAKAALLMDETSLTQHLERYPRVIAVAVKTLLYSVVGLALGYLERIVETLHKTHSLTGAMQNMAAGANHNRILAWALGISMMFALYFTFFEISIRMGKGALWALFFDSPQSAAVSSSIARGDVSS